MSADPRGKILVGRGTVALTSLHHNMFLCKSPNQWPREHIVSLDPWWRREQLCEETPRTLTFTSLHLEVLRDKHLDWLCQVLFSLSICPGAKEEWERGGIAELGVGWGVTHLPCGSHGFWGWYNKNLLKNGLAALSSHTPLVCFLSLSSLLNSTLHLFSSYFS